MASGGAKASNHGKKGPTVPRRKSVLSDAAAEERKARASTAYQGVRVHFFKNGDPNFKEIRMVVARHKYPTLNSLMDYLTTKIPLAYGVKNIYSATGVKVDEVGELVDGENYVVSSSGFKPGNYGQKGALPHKPKKRTRVVKSLPGSPTRQKSPLKKEDTAETVPPVRRMRNRTGSESTNGHSSYDVDPADGLREPARHKSKAHKERDGSATKKGDESDEEEKSAYPTYKPRRLGPTPETRTPSPNVDEYGRPSLNLELEYVFGYRGYDCRDNIHFTKTGKLAFHVAAVAVVFDRETGVQKFYRNEPQKQKTPGHTDDILCLAVHPKKDIIATGQVGRKPTIHVWDAVTFKQLAVLAPNHNQGVCALAFSSSGRKLASVGTDTEHTVTLWDWKAQEEISRGKGHGDMVFAVKFEPDSKHNLAICGVKHVKFLHPKGKEFKTHRGVFGDKAEPETMLCMEFSNEPGILYTGGSSGRIFCWNEHDLSRIIEAHKGACLAIVTTPDGAFASGGKDGHVILWDDKMESQTESPFEITKKNFGPDVLLAEETVAIRSLAIDQGSIVVGTKMSEILETDRDDRKIRTLLQGHGQGEAWGLAPHPISKICATASDDGFMRVWDFQKEDHFKLLSLHNFKKPVRSVAYSNNGKLIAVGFKNGRVKVLSAKSGKEEMGFHNRKEEISDLKFSPDDHYLAVGSHDNFVDFYETKKGTRVGVGQGASSYITHLDWDTTGKRLQINSGASEHLFFEVDKKNNAWKRTTMTDDEVEDTPWHTWTGVLGECVVGIFPADSDITDVNATHLNPREKVLAVGDDFGFVKLFSFPSPEEHAKCKKYLAHSSHVTNVRWSHDGHHLMSLGGQDTALMLWKSVESDGESSSTHGAHTYTDASEQEDSESE